MRHALSNPARVAYKHVVGHGGMARSYLPVHHRHRATNLQGAALDRAWASFAQHPGSASALAPRVPWDHSSARPPPLPPEVGGRAWWDIQHTPWPDPCTLGPLPPVQYRTLVTESHTVQLTLTLLKQYHLSLIVARPSTQGRCTGCGRFRPVSGGRRARTRKGN